MTQDLRHRWALPFILLTVLIDTIGFGIIIPVLPELVMELTGENLSGAAIYAGYLLFVYALMQFLFAPIMGNLSDRFGRRPVILLALGALGVDYILMGFAPTIAFLFAGRLLAGIFGATATAANAYIADVSTPEKRAANFGLIGAAWGLGFILGPVIGGILGEYGPRVPFFAAAGLALANVIYGYFVLPETLAPEDRRPFTWARANTLGAFREVAKYPVIVGLFAALILYQIAHDANPSAWTYYTMLKFGWNEREVGYSMGFVGLMIILVMGGGTRVIIPRLGEGRAAMLGLVLSAIGFTGFAFSTEGWMMYVFVVPFAFMGLAMPAMRGIMSNQVPDNAQGELQGAITACQSLTMIVAPLLMTRLFNIFTTGPHGPYFPGAPFLLAGVCMLGAMLLVLRTLRATRQVV